MTANKIVILLITIVMSVTTAASAQSLADIAREQRQKQPAKDTAPPRKVITNDDLPEDETEEDVPDEPQPARNREKFSRRPANDRPSFTPNTPSDPGAADRLRTKIGAQKRAVDSLQSQIKQLQDSVRFVEANRYTNGAQYNQEQSRKQQEVERLQKKLDDEKAKLEDMQESARKAGFGSAVYDP